MSDPETLRERAAASINHPLTRALLVLTFATGLIDAVSFLALGEVFTANQTGNIILLGLGVAGSGGLEVVGPLISLLAFIAGAFAGGVLGTRLGDRHPRHMAVSLGIETGLVAAAAVVAAAADLHPGGTSADVVIALLAGAMGCRTATVRWVGVPDLPTTVNTLGLTGLVAESPAAGGSGRGSVRRGVAILAMLAGAIAGALLLDASVALPLAASAVLALAVWGVYVPAARRGI